MENLFDPLGRYAADVHIGFARNYRRDKGLIAFLVACGWLLLPFLLHALLFPSSMVKLLCKMQHLKLPPDVANQEWYFAIALTAFLLVVLVVFEWVGNVLFYRRAMMDNAPVATPALWPLALIVSLCGNAAWFVGLGVFDPVGFAIGVASVAVTIIGEMIVEGLGRDFVLGSAASNLHPQMRSQY